ncbi:MAG: hypothetical protein ACLQU2_00860 [Candidatus Binataceae bacterium]
MNATSLAPCRLLRRAEAARYVQDGRGYPCSPKTLAKYAVVGGGPRFRKAGRFPLYDPNDLDDWINDKLSDLVTSTSALVSDATEEQRVNPETPRPRCRIAGAVANESLKAHRSTT